MEAIIDVDKTRAVADVIKILRLERDRYLDGRFYPPLDDPREDQLAYFVSMVAVDHRTSTPLGPFKGYIDGEFFHGADALWRLGRKAYDDGLFKAERLAELTPKDAERLFSIGGEKVWDFNVRLFLLRDLGRKALLAGGFEALVPNAVAQLAERLRHIRAYEDPVRKKVLLLAKFLDGRGLVKFVDPENFDVPVDNHLSRIAYRLGIVDVDYKFLFLGVELDREEDVEVRNKVKLAWRLVAKFSGVDPFTLDDFLWSFGRRVCIREFPKCGQCPFRSICKAHALGSYPPEHAHTLTWYY
ncbi:MAG: iron-sulfur cluster loop [Thermoproteus sp.]